MSTTHLDAIVIRHATAADARTVAELAILDSREPLSGPALIAEVDGVARAALDLSDGSVVADPFAYTGELVELLRCTPAPPTARASSATRSSVALPSPCDRSPSVHSAAFVAYVTLATDAAGSVATDHCLADGSARRVSAGRAPAGPAGHRGAPAPARPRRLAVRRARPCEAC